MRSIASTAARTSEAGLDLEEGETRVPRVEHIHEEADDPSLAVRKAEVKPVKEEGNLLKLPMTPGALKIFEMLQANH